MDTLLHLLFFSGLCSFAVSIPRDYVLIPQQKTWVQAQTFCRQNHIDLATVQSNEDYGNLQQTVYNMATMAWIGLYEDINSWRWSYRNMKIVFSTWSAEEPNNFNGEEACGLIQDGNWNDWNCSILFPFVCLHENGTDRFVFISDAKTWPDAQSYCRQHYTDLAVIQNDLENRLVSSQMKTYSSAWIGLFRDTWKWSDGTNVSTSSFAWPGKQPKMNTLQIPCGVSDSGGLTSYQICSSALPFLCILRAKKQIVRVMVKNIQNRNDPAAMEGIVDWISQMLKKWGLETQTKVTLRIQPDGNVFTLFKKPCKQNMCQSEAAEHC